MKTERFRPERSRPRSRFGPLDFAFWLPAVFLVYLALGAVMHHLPTAFPLTYGIISLASVACYAQDKRKAERGEWRTPESVLHVLDLLGGWPGGLLAQRVFRHKTRKLSFQAIFWICVAAHLAAWGWIFVTIPAEADFFRFGQKVASAGMAIFHR
jgi:uncharacterized membrane protein YsdA (DUF1294 family)